MESEREGLEYVLTHAYKRDMIVYMETHPGAFREAVELALGDTQPLSWRAAWLLVDCIRADDPRLRKHIGRIIAAVPGKKDGHQRELLKLLQRMTLRGRHEGEAFDLCVTLWQNIQAQPSVRVNALMLLVSITRKHPALSREIGFLTQDRYLDTLSGPVRKSVARILKGRMRG